MKKSIFKFPGWSLIWNFLFMFFVVGSIGTSLMVCDMIQKNPQGNAKASQTEQGATKVTKTKTTEQLQRSHEDKDERLNKPTPDCKKDLLDAYIVKAQENALASLPPSPTSKEMDYQALLSLYTGMNHLDTCIKFGEGPIGNRCHAEACLRLKKDILFDFATMQDDWRIQRICPKGYVDDSECTYIFRTDIALAAGFDPNGEHIDKLLTEQEITELHKAFIKGVYEQLIYLSDQNTSHDAMISIRENLCDVYVQSLWEKYIGLPESYKQFLYCDIDHIYIDMTDGTNEIHVP